MTLYNSAHIVQLESIEILPSECKTEIEGLLSSLLLLIEFDNFVYN